VKVVGLTGGIATGKSTVGRLLRERGVPVIDADQVARDVVAPGSPGLAKVVDRFGRDVLLPDGALDRGKLRAVVVRDAQARKDLEAITHPAIREAIGQRLAELAASGAPVAVVEAALMVETGSWKLYDALIVVSCAPETQLRRLVERDGHPEPEARAMIATQLPMAEKEKVATVVIRNDADLAALRDQLDRAWDRISSG
jgi:dephospho-CoA kinase